MGRDLVQFRGAQGEVRHRAVWHRLEIHIFENLDVVAVTRIEHRRTFRFGLPGDLFRTAEHITVELDRLVPVSCLDAHVVKAAVAENGIGHNWTKYQVTSSQVTRGSAW